MFGEIGQTITVVNKSGKIVSNSKHLVNVFKEARAAYRERKAEIHYTRDAEHQEKRARHELKRLNLEEHERQSSRSSRHSDSPRRSKSTRPPTQKPLIERGYSDSFFVNDPPAPRNGTTPPVYYSPSDGPSQPHPPKRSNTSPLQFDPHLAYGEDVQRMEIMRRHSDGSTLTATHKRRSRSLDDIDMDLAYGELPPPLPARRMDEETELRGKVTRLQQILDEANCLQHSVTSTIENLQKNPEALAAVGLALAEVSNLVTKMAPGALTVLKGSFPAVFALLASPQFLIAAGVGVGVTVVMLGGYKIIKRIKDKKELEKEPAFEDGQMMELQSQGLGSIENWRRGIAEAEAESVGTTVDGEFITPMAGRRLLEEGTLKPEDLKSSKSGKRKSKEHGKAKSTTSKGSKSSSKSEKDRKKKKEPSGLRMLFKSHSSAKE
ncbi:hypothetical protein NA57DRAFT_57382 [Rhizodiscina lignyota]|uniref:Uncharacterized protein n=1 Tax=Rhizodiscina lignyota TaxID=1504668 RepID=A0A9P4M5L5_9PEZI|nr:hypothetical protein NA57DRAFT_57382 [Rhizodiscina lignyota]